jgi:DNA polymerase-3 subunit delta'
VSGRFAGAPAFAPALDLARRGQLYPAVILYGGVEEVRGAEHEGAGPAPVARRDAALELGRALLCLAEPPERACGHCRNCARIAWPGGRQEAFHPDFRVLERDLKTSTSVDATKALVQLAQSAPFEARGQVFVVANAETLSGEAANALLKMLEEPPSRAPRHFLLLAPSRLDLLPTLRSRSLSVFLGAGEALDPRQVEEAAERLAAALGSYEATGAGVFLLRAAAALVEEGGFEDPRASRPWSLAAAAARRAADRSPRLRRGLLDLADALLQAPDSRLRGITAERIAEGLVARHLAG